MKIDYWSEIEIALEMMPLVHINLSIHIAHLSRPYHTYILRKIQFLCWLSHQKNRKLILDDYKIYTTVLIELYIIGHTFISQQPKSRRESNQNQGEKTHTDIEIIDWESYISQNVVNLITNYRQFLFPKEHSFISFFPVDHDY